MEPPPESEVSPESPLESVVLSVVLSVAPLSEPPPEGVSMRLTPVSKVQAESSPARRSAWDGRGGRWTWLASALHRVVP
jgi:hypothetical protein